MTASFLYAFSQHTGYTKVVRHNDLLNLYVLKLKKRKINLIKVGGEHRRTQVAHTKTINLIKPR